MNGQMNLKFSINNYNRQRKKDLAGKQLDQQKSDNWHWKVLKNNNYRKINQRKRLIYNLKRKKL